MTTKTKYWCDWCGDEMENERGKSKPLLDAEIMKQCNIRDGWLDGDVCASCRGQIHETVGAALNMLHQALRRVAKVRGR